MLLYLQDGPAQTTVRDATLGQTLQTKPTIPPTHRALTHSQPALAMTLQRQALGRVTTRVRIFTSLVRRDRETTPPGFDPQSAALEADAFTTKPPRRCAVGSLPTLEIERGSDGLWHPFNQPKQVPCCGYTVLRQCD